jgi:2-polyprenyl-6-methoxyphenol hydroxylase-like FAD-dependent oxidoreductase
MASDEISVAIIGGGIGGLAAASSLLRVGIDVHVYEQARELTEVGAGIQISPNASRILHRLGLADALANVGVRPLAESFRTPVPVESNARSRPFGRQQAAISSTRRTGPIGARCGDGPRHD